MNLLRASEQIDTGYGNHWPLIVPPASIALWWPILAVAFGVRVATIFAVIASCLVAIVAALAALADALGLQDGLIHIDEDALPSLSAAKNTEELPR